MKRYFPTFLFEFICTEDTRVKICHFASCLTVTDSSLEVLSVPPSAKHPLRWKMHDWVFQSPWGRPTREVITLRRWLDYGWNCWVFSTIVGLLIVGLDQYGPNWFLKVSWRWSFNHFEGHSARLEANFKALFSGCLLEKTLNLQTHETSNFLPQGIFLIYPKPRRIFFRSVLLTSWTLSSSAWALLCPRRFGLRKWHFGDGAVDGLIIVKLKFQYPSDKQNPTSTCTCKESNFV